MLLYMWHSRNGSKSLVSNTWLKWLTCIHTPFSTCICIYTYIYIYFVHTFVHVRLHVCILLFCKVSKIHRSHYGYVSVCMYVYINWVHAYIWLCVRMYSILRGKYDKYNTPQRIGQKCSFANKSMFTSKCAHFSRRKFTCQ